MRGSAVFRTGVAPGGALAGPWVRDPLWTRARAVPSLDLRFADNKSLVDAVTGAQLVTFTRASSGTYVGSDGVLRSAVTNLLRRSEEFDNVYWTKNATTVTPNATTAPNGTTTADKLVETAVFNSHWAGALSLGLASNIYTTSVYAKAAERSQLAIFIDTSVARRTQYFNLSTGALGASSGGITSAIQAVGNGWYRCSITLLAAESFINAVYAIAVSGSIDYTGDGTSGIFLWGAQLEQSATVGEYIPTTSVINSAPRFDHNPTTGESLGLLVEEARTNLCLQSEDFATTWTQQRATITTNTTLAPNGTTTADTITGNGATGGTQSVFQSITVSASTAYTINVYAKAGTSTWMTIQGFDGTTNCRAWFDLVNGATGSVETGMSNATITNAGGGWYRCSVVRTTGIISTSLRPQFGQATSNGAEITGGVLTFALWGAQVEAGAFPTSYIPTTTATVTRAADVASITGSNFSSWYNQTEGTVFAEARTQQSAAAHVLAGFSTGSFASSAYLSKESSNFLVAAPDAAPSNINIGLLSVSSNVGLRAALAFTAGTGSASAVMNGGTVNTDPSTGIPITMSQMAIGSAPWSIGSNSWNGTIKRLTCWPTRLATLQAITQP